MKKLLGLYIALLLMFTLTACDDIYIEPDVVTVMYDNIRYEGDSVIVDIWITNGTDEDYDVGYVEFWFELPEDSENEAIGAGFDIYETVKKGRYKFYEIEFESKYIFVTKTELAELNLSLTDLEFYFWFDE